MEPQVLNSNLINTKILENFDSFIWTDRFCGYGDFELITRDIFGTLNKLIGGQYLYLKESKHIMVLEDLDINEDPENGDLLILKGRSLESILDRRIVWDQTSFKTDVNFQDTIEQILNDNAINPIVSDRQITKLNFEASIDPIITALTLNKQFYGEFIYDVIVDLCKSKNIGFKIELDANRLFVFKLYAGTDRSYGQFVNRNVVFSKNFDNLLNSQYKESTIPLKTVALVAGEKGVGNLRTIREVPQSGGGTDLDRREMFVDAQGVTRNVSGQTPLTDDEYNDLLDQKGTEELAKRTVLTSFEAQIDPTKTYTLGVDFFMGDIVQIVDDYGHEKKSRITEIIHFHDKSGSGIYPTFAPVE